MVIDLDNGTIGYYVNQLERRYTEITALASEMLATMRIPRNQEAMATPSGLVQFLAFFKVWEQRHDEIIGRAERKKASAL